MSVMDSLINGIGSREVSAVVAAAAGLSIVRTKYIDSDVIVCFCCMPQHF